MNNQEILDNAPEGADSDVVDITGAYFDEHCNHLNSEGFWSELDITPVSPRSLADIARIAELENQWVSVKDRLPELEDNSVLVHFLTGSIETVHIEDNFKDITNGFGKDGNQLYTKWYISAGITHWMPLPNPPMEQTHENS
jgi:hypothetical protein